MQSPRSPLTIDRRANDLDGTITDGGELTESYAIENGEVKMTKAELITMIGNAGFEAVERDTVYNRMASA